MVLWTYAKTNGLMDLCKNINDQSLSSKLKHSAPHWTPEEQKIRKNKSTTEMITFAVITGIFPTYSEQLKLFPNAQEFIFWHL